MKSCPDCPPDLSLASFGKGSGRCSRCHGTGEYDESSGGVLVEFLSLDTVHPDITCKLCYGTGQCQTCGGTGYIYEESENSYDDESQDHEYKSSSYDSPYEDSSLSPSDKEKYPTSRKYSPDFFDILFEYGFEGGIYGAILLGIAGFYTCVWEAGGGEGPWHTEFHFLGGLGIGFLAGCIIGCFVGYIKESN